MKLLRLYETGFLLRRIPQFTTQNQTRSKNNNGTDKDGKRTYPTLLELLYSIANDPLQNLSFILNKPHDVTFAEKPIPTLHSPYDVLIAINYTGICGSDVHYWEEGRIGSFILKDPMVLGHESAGTIVKIGSAVKSLKVGDRVALEPGTPCRRCEACLSGHYNLCPEMRFAASPPIDGTLTGFYTSAEDFCYKLPENVSLQEGALLEPLSVAVHITKQAEIQPGQSVVVMGAGPVGLLCCAVAKAYGATKVVSVDIQKSRLEFAASYAATHTFMPERVSAEENAARLLKETGLEGGADAVIDASGAEPSIQTSIHTVRRGGVYVQGGMGKPDITFPIMALCIKEVTCKGSFRYGSGDYKLALEFVSSGKVNVKKLISETVKFKDAEQAFKDVKSGKGIKMLIAGPNER
jgi:D-xylulose reductase